MNKEWTCKLESYCLKEHISMNLFLQIICSSIIQKTDPTINIFIKMHEQEQNKQEQNKQEQNKQEQYIRYDSCSILYNSPQLLSIYTRLHGSVRQNIKRILSDKFTINKNRIHVHSNVGKRGETCSMPFYNGSMRNLISSIEFTSGKDKDIQYNMFGIKINNMYLIMSSVLWEMRELIQFILT